MIASSCGFSLAAQEQETTESVVWRPKRDALGDGTIGSSWGGSRAGEARTPERASSGATGTMRRETAAEPRTDRPRTNRDPAEVDRKLSLLREPHVAPLTEFVEHLRRSKPAASVPYFDPTEAGKAARILLLLEAPGRRSALEAGSGFVSPDNDDQTAHNMWELLRDAEINRARVVATWNVVPWYIGDGTKIRAARASGLDDARAATLQLLLLLSELRVVVLFGRPAAKAWRSLGLELEAIEAPHPSPLNLNSAPSDVSRSGSRSRTPWRSPNARPRTPRKSSETAPAAGNPTAPRRLPARDCRSASSIAPSTGRCTTSTSRTLPSAALGELKLPGFPRVQRSSAGEPRSLRAAIYGAGIDSGPFRPLRRMAIDVTKQVAEITLDDGMVQSAALTRVGGPDWAIFARLDADLIFGELEVALRTGELVRVKLGWPGRQDLPPAEIPVAYLDQNHWVTLTRQVHAPDLVDDVDREAAEILVALARAERLILPLSSAHLVEAARWGRQRLHSALTALELSRGYQMRNPLLVRRQELAAAIAGEMPRGEAVFSLEPDIIFSDATPVEPPTGLPPAVVELHRRLTSLTANIAVMVEDFDDDGAGAAAAQRWADVYQRFADKVHQQKLPPDQTRESAHLALLADLTEEAATAALSVGVGAEEAAKWIEHGSAAAFQQAPLLRTLEELLYWRLRDANDRWEPHDLHDMHFLSCAAGYADLVVAEKKFGDYLQRTRRRYSDNARIATNLSAAVETLI